MNGHFLPFGCHKGKSPADTPTDYLRWLLRTCKLSSGLHAAVREELQRRGVDVSDLPVERVTKRPASCRRCGGVELRLYWQELANNTRLIRGDCRRCGKFISFQPQSAENVARADAAKSATGLLDLLTRAEDEGVSVVSVNGRTIHVIPPGKASPELLAMVRQNKHLLLSMLPAEMIEGYA
jgi:hypothetical protein